MEFRLAEPTFEEAKDAERDSDEIIIGIECHGCDYQLWTNIRKGITTEIRCSRDDCNAVTELAVTNYMEYSGKLSEISS